MFFPKTEFCPFNDGLCDSSPNPCVNKIQTESDLSNSNMETAPEYNEKCELMKKIQEMSFAVVDLNLFLDTHPDCEQALALFKKLSAMLKSMKADYQSKYGPLYATQSSDMTPFTWVSEEQKWPWEL